MRRWHLLDQDSGGRSGDVCKLPLRHVLGNHRTGGVRGLGSDANALAAPKHHCMQSPTHIRLCDMHRLAAQPSLWQGWPWAALAYPILMAVSSHT
jgi:hypothetical protein